MFKIYVNKISGFEVCEDIAIYSANLKPFYVKRSNGAKIQFNLPIGIYYSNIDLKPLKQKFEYKKPKLPPFENVLKPRKTTLVFCVNKNKCSIDLPTGIIMLDNSFRNATRPELEFVIEHEKAHYFYRGTKNSETFCDIMAAYKMIEKGYNPSQLVFSCNSCLTHSEKRKENIFNYSKQIYK